MMLFTPPTLKESGTLPRGPREVSEVWRANARFGYTVMSLYMWDSTAREEDWSSQCGR